MLLTSGESKILNLWTAPWKFTEKMTKQMTENEMTLVHLQGGEKSWPVKFHSYPEHQYGKFDYGIAAFAWKNFLETGDDCVFELINKKDAIAIVKFESVHLRLPNKEENSLAGETMSSLLARLLRL
ncbi:hypothetical protein ACFE04_020195 [Oxalis oulophora]